MSQTDFLLKMVGAVRFELTTSCTRNKRATKLRYAPNLNFSFEKVATSGSSAVDDSGSIVPET